MASNLSNAKAPPMKKSTTTHTNAYTLGWENDQQNWMGIWHKCTKEKERKGME